MVELWNDIKNLPVTPILAISLIVLEGALVYLIVGLYHHFKK